jgi:8-oxo-dGTP diphosphatase
LPIGSPESDLPKLAFDHEKIIQTALNDIKSGLVLELIGHSNEEFTLLQLQNIFFAILNLVRNNKKLCDRRNFKKKKRQKAAVSTIDSVPYLPLPPIPNLCHSLQFDINGNCLC